MKLAEMIQIARIASDDTVAPFLWSDAEWRAYANQAQCEACRRARLIVDSSTQDVTEIALVAGTASYDLDSRVLFIRRAKLNGRSATLKRISYQDLDAAHPEWEDASGEPSHYVPDFDAKFRPYPTPDVDGLVRLTVIRLPLADMAGDADAPEIAPHYHDGLINWMLYRAFSKPDTETLDKTKVATMLEAFEDEFGKRSTAQDEAWLQREHDFLANEGNY